MPLQIVLDKLDDLAPHFQELYTEKDGRYHLTGVEGMKTQADIDRLNSALIKEKNDHKTVREKYSVFGDKDPTEILSSLDRISELELAAAGKIDETKINEMVESRLKTKISPIERERDKFKTDLAAREEIITAYQDKERRRTIADAIREATIKSNVIPTAVEDVTMLAERMFEVTDDGKVVTKDGVGVTPGVDASVWLSDMQAKRPHWWPASQGGGSKGSGSGSGFADNPFSADGWNLTKQGELLKSDRSKAEQMAKVAGTHIGGPKPFKK